MTISTTNNSVTGNGDGSNTSFAYNFLMLPGSDTVTYTDPTGISVPLVRSLYTITGLGNPAGGTVVFPLTGSPMAVGAKLQIERVLSLVQETTISNQGAFYSKAVEAALDYLMMCIQQLEQQISTILTDIVDLQNRVTILEHEVAALQSLVTGGGGGGWAPPAGAVEVKQLKFELVSENRMRIVENAMTADVADLGNVQWTTGGWTVVGDPLSNAIQTALGWTTAQMITLYQNAAAQPV